MLGGEGLSYGDRRQIDTALDTAKRVSELDVEAYLGPVGDDARGFALALLARQARPAETVLVVCDPDARALEIVTGRRAREYLDDTACRLAAAAMTSSFIAGDVVGGLSIGIQQLGGAARHPETLHAD